MKFHTLTAFTFLLFLQQTTLHAKGSVFNDVSYYVVAHEDDWQLFMGTNVANDIISGEKVVVIHVTAGDLGGNQEPYGYDVCTQNQNVPYYRVREQGAEYSMHLMAESSGSCFSPLPSITFPVIAGHPVRRYEYRNTVMYFMRVIDNDLNSMAANHTIPGRTIDNSSTYVNWCDLTRTLANILLMERVVDNNTGWLNIPDIDTGINPNDHTSHYSAATAALYAVKFVIGENYPTALFVDYHTENLPPNLGPLDAANEAGMSAVYNIALIYNRLWNEWRTPNDIFQVWSARNYYRIENSDDIRLEFIDCCRHCRPTDRSSTDDKIGQDILLTPNPNTGLMTITVEEETDANSKVSVYDLKGKLIFESVCQQQVPLTIDMRGQTQGTYMVHAHTKSGTRVHKAIFVRE